MMVSEYWRHAWPAQGIFRTRIPPGFRLPDGEPRIPEETSQGEIGASGNNDGNAGRDLSLYFGAHGLKNLKRNILGFCGIAPVHETLFGMVQGVSNAARNRWIERMRSLGASAS